MAESGWVERAVERIDKKIELEGYGVTVDDMAAIIREEYAKDELRVAAVELANDTVKLMGWGYSVELAKRVLRLAGEA